MLHPAVGLSKVFTSGTSASSSVSQRSSPVDLLFQEDSYAGPGASIFTGAVKQRKIISSRLPSLTWKAPHLELLFCFLASLLCLSSHPFRMFTYYRTCPWAEPSGQADLIRFLNRAANSCSQADCSTHPLSLRRLRWL